MPNSKRKQRIGTVISSNMNKTIVVRVQWFSREKMYGKIMRRFTKFKVHDEKNSARPADTVKIEETRPLSKEKRWRLLEIIKKASQ